MKILIIFVVFQVLSVFGANVPNSESGNGKLEPLENIFSNHMPQFLEPLNLTTGELKLFAGHSFQMIKAKCPAISQDRLSLINKYITKLISRTNTVQGSSSTFKNLVSSISTCTQHQITDEEKSKRQQSFFQFFFHPLRSFKNLFGSSDSSKKDNKDSVAESPDTLPLETESAPPPVEIINLQGKDEKLGSLGKDDDDDDFVVASSSSSPNVEAETQANVQDTSGSPFIRIFYTTTNDDDTTNDEGLSPWDPLGWLGSVFRAIRNFFSGMFGAENRRSDPIIVPVSTQRSAPVARVKRSAEDDAPPKPTEQIEVVTEITEKIEIDTTEKTVLTLKGREAFMILIDNMCRIYCNECLDQSQIRNYKAASKELLQLILTDTTGIELASKHFLEADFLQSLNEC